MLTDLSDFSIRVIEALGYLGFALLVVLEGVIPMIPSEVVLALGGFAASRGEFEVVTTIVVATIASVVGAWAFYGVAAYFGPAPLYAGVRRYGKWFGISEDDLHAAQRWFDRWSVLAVGVSRCVPLARSLISVPAGFARMSLMSFTLSTALGSLVWNTIFVLAGYALGEQWERVLPYADYFQTAVFAACFVTALFVVYWLWRRRHA